MAADKCTETCDRSVSSAWTPDLCGKRCTNLDGHSGRHNCRVHGGF
jgi:hypothetical protein